METIGRRLLALGTALVTAAGLTVATSTPTQASPAHQAARQATPSNSLTNQAPIKVAAADKSAKKGTTTRAVRGAPVNPQPYQVTQPDGSKVTLQDHGDNLRNWSTAPNGATVAKDSAGYWRYANRLDAKGQPVAGATKADVRLAPPAGSKGLKPSKDRAVAPTNDKAPFVGFTGTQRTVVILAQFTNLTSRGTTPAHWAQNFFGASGSVRAFYKGASFNKLDVAPAAETSGTANDGVVGWVTLPMTHPNTGQSTDSRNQALTAAAIQAANPYVNYAAFDTNGDGYIVPAELHITVIVAGYEGSYYSACTPNVWGHQWAVAAAPTVDGKVVGRYGYTQFGEQHCATTNTADAHMATIGIMAHEFGHDLGWPDLYDPTYASNGIGEWSLMAMGSWGTSAGGHAGNLPTLPDAYSKYLQGWTAPTVVTSPTSISLGSAATTNQSVLLGANPSGAELGGNGEYFLVENRQPTGLDGALPGCGLVVYHVAERFTNNNYAASGRLIDVEEAAGPQDLETNGANRGDPGDPWHGVAGHTQFAASTVPNSNLYSGAVSGASVVQNGGCGSLMTANFTGNGAVPAGPANDNFVNGRNLTGSSGSWTQSTANATAQTGEPNHAGQSGGASVWFNWTAPSTGNLTVASTGSGYDTLMGIYTGTAVNALTVRAFNDDENYDGGIYTSRVAGMPVVAGTTYRIAVDGYAGETGTLQLAWSFTPSVATPKYVSLAPVRILDTRYGTGAPRVLVPAGGKIDLQVTGRGGVPAGAGVVALNVTAVAPTGPGNGYVTVWPTGAVRPTASNLNFLPGQTIPNLVVAKVGAGGKVSLFTAVKTHLIADVAGYYPTGAAFTGVTPVRILDTRWGIGAPKVRIPAGGTVTLTVAGSNGVPANASAAMVNITTVAPAGAGTVTAYPTGVAVPNATSVSYRNAQTIAGLGVVKLGTGGRITLRSTASTELIVDLAGWVPLGADTVAFTPYRLLTAHPVAAGGSFSLRVAGVGSVPADAKAVQVTVTASGSAGSGYVTVWPTGSTRPVVSNLNFTSGGSISNSAIVKVGTGGLISVYTSGATSITVDTSAYWTP